MGEADGLAEAAWDELIINNEIVVPLLLETFSIREKDNTLGRPHSVGQEPYRSIIRDGTTIHQRLKNRRPRATSGGAT